jgi:predicted regulator of Ras-like GTPase activity (Roadblock/LC7/MglB family)
MNVSDIEQVLHSLNAESEDILLSMVVSSDGLPLAYHGQSHDFDEAGAYYIELKLICEKVLAGLKIGQLEHVFVHAQHGCVDILPIDDMGVLACMTRPGMSTRKLQLYAWRAASSLRKIMSQF